MSKSLVKLSGFSDDFLTSSSLKVLLPTTFADNHEKFLKDYLKRKDNILKKVIINQSWMKKMNGTLRAVKINIMPRYDVKDDLRLIGFVETLKKIEMFD